MPAARLRSALLAGALSVPSDARPDGELLQRFLADGDEVAFAVLVARHTPTVRAACRCWLRSAADIDDAAQAAFFVLVRRAASIRDPAALSRWLYRVAENVSRRLRQQLLRTGPLPADVPDREPPTANELADALMEEVARLPEKYRLAVQLCHVAGLSTADAAGRLNCPKGTVLTRLARGRELLRRRLLARGAVPAALLAPAARAVDSAWVWLTANAAKGLLAGEGLDGYGVSERTITLTEGAVRIMLWNKLKVVVVAAMLATGVVGFTVGRWASADPSGPFQRSTNRAAPPAPPVQLAPPASAPAKPDEAKPPAPGRRREAVIRVPVGTFVKEVEVAPYGSGRLTWTFEEDRILGTIEASVMGFEVELATEAEFALSSSGTIYGIVTGVKMNQLRVGGQFAELQQFAGLWPLVEPLVAEMLTDLPFSYQFRQSGDRLSIHNFRMLLAGPNPLGKVGPLLGGDMKEVTGFLMGFQAIAVAIEGTYTAADGKDAPKPRPKFKRASSFPTFSLPVQPVIVAAPRSAASMTPGFVPATPGGTCSVLPPVAPAPTGKPSPATSNRTPPVPATLPPVTPPPASRLPATLPPAR